MQLHQHPWRLRNIRATHQQGRVMCAPLILAAVQLGWKVKRRQRQQRGQRCLLAALLLHLLSS
jgi:hypothetical protein